MRTLRNVVAVLILIVGQSQAADESFGGIKLLDGYSLRLGVAVDAVTWMIEKPGGLRIEFESGPSEGSWADPKQRPSYAFYREQQINGYGVRIAVTHPDVMTVWEPDDNRKLPPGNILLVTFLLGGDQSSHTANFVAKVANRDELVDAVLMVLTFDPSKGTF